MQLALARENMLKQQIRTFGVTDEQILGLLTEIPRENFLPENLKSLAYADVAIPIGHGQAMLPPKETAFMLQALAVKKDEKVLVIGVESGYILAFLGKLAKQVEAIDSNSELIRHAQEKLTALGIANVKFSKGDGTAGWEKGGPYQVIIITGSIPFLPKSFQKNLARNGRIFAIIGNPPVMEATILKRDSQHWLTEKIFETNHPRLPNARESKKFVF